ncbi:hypothetical protein AK812_SmicGene34839 [Symbiodinium microadriaticum]|uniref:Uncharacterized protein n=1 Tax=Symbiodinium microadriaticum TaxID=2951 RepID=A0A1Q9CN67_SYMMI|nr:hypothetical protein AK812_SmicGene34839 [Symbiodinium microadriaticum]
MSLPWLVVCVSAQLVVPVHAFDPIADVNQLLILVLLVLGVYLAFLYRDRVMVLLTGDDRFHVDLNSMIWKVLTLVWKL